MEVFTTNISDAAHGECSVFEVLLSKETFIDFTDGLTQTGIQLKNALVIDTFDVWRGQAVL